MNLKGILFVSMILFILSVSVVSAGDLNDNENFNATSNNSSYLQTNNNDLNDCNAGLGCLQKNPDTNDVNHTNNQNNILNNENSLDISGMVIINQTSDNTFICQIDNTTTTVYRVYVYDLDSFINATRTISSDIPNYDAIVVDFKDNALINVDLENKNLIKLLSIFEINLGSENLIGLGNTKNIILRGNNATIALNNSNERDEKHFMNIGEYHKLWMNDITIKGFNSAIVNRGACQFRNVTFDSNRESYIFFEDHGGAIRNYGILQCSNCTFSKNKAKNGGAVYNYKGSQSMFFNCIFTGNIASSKADFGYIQTADGDNIFTSKGANCFISNNDDNIYSISINTTSDLNNALNAITKLGHVRDLVIDFAPNANIKISKSEGFKFSFDYVENLFILGNGATISVDTENSDECHFLKVSKGQNYQINNLVIKGFNRAIINEGSLSLTNTTFSNNKCDYCISKDYGGAIYNDEGILYLTECRFENSYAKYGGAIYNNHGVVRCSNCSFESNTAYSDGGAIYNYEGHLVCIQTLFSKNNAEDDGGAIYNDHGEMVLNDNVFDRSVAADEGGAIYNDFGSITLSNNIFSESQAATGNDLFTYGEESRYYSANDSFVIRQVEDGFICQKLKVTSDSASEAIRWTLRISEISLCIALCIACSVSGMPESAATVIGFVGGGLFAAGEELIEDCYLDHNFNVWNVVVMAVIAGIIDGAATGAGTWIGKSCFKVGTPAFTSAAKLKLEAICFCLELGGEILTEFLPRFDFSTFEVPTPPEYNATSVK